MPIVQGYTRSFPVPDLELIDYAFAGDFGGGSLRPALYGIDANYNLYILLKQKIPNSEFKGVEETIDGFLQEIEKHHLPRPLKGVLGCAGIIDGNKCTFTNFDVSVDADALQKRFGIEFYLGNDFKTHAAAVPFLDKSHLKQIPHMNTNTLTNHEQIFGIIGPGTGLGVGSIKKDPVTGLYTPIASEGGHGVWAPHGKLQRALEEFLQSKYHYTSFGPESVASAIGISNMLHFVMDGHIPLHDESSHTLRRLHDHASFHEFYELIAEQPVGTIGRAVIKEYRKGSFNHGLDPIMNIFNEGVSQAAINAANLLGAYGGIYLSGGNLRRLENDSNGACLFSNTPYFMQRFENHAGHPNKLRATPVYIITSDTFGTEGAARIALDPRVESPFNRK